MPAKCQLPEHTSRKRGPCSACGGCKLCPLQNDGCKANHIGSVNPAKQSESNKRKRRKSGGTPQRDAARAMLLYRMRCMAAQLKGDGVANDPQPTLPILQKIPLMQLEKAASVIVQELVNSILEVSEWEDETSEKKNVISRIVGDLSISHGAGTTIAESDTMVTKMSKLVTHGAASTERFVMSIVCASISYRRAREVFSSLSLTDGETTQLGEMGFRSRRKDFQMLESGGELESRLGFVRLKKENITNALTFIQNNCDLSWRNGHLVSRVIGKAKVELPRLRRHLTMEFLFDQYVRWCEDQSLGAVGRHQFHDLLRLITVEVHEVTGASYYFTDGVIDSFKIIKELLTRLRTIVSPSNAAVVGTLIERSAALQYFVKYDLKSHMVVAKGGSTEGFHCVRHAVNGECNHEHLWKCKSCAALDRLADDIVYQIEHLQRDDDGYSDEVKSMVACMRRVGGQIHRYVKHVARAVWQHARIADAKIDVARNPHKKNTVLFVDLDHKQKVLGRKLVENQTEYFGKVGMSLLGAMIMSSADEETSAASESTGADGATVSLHFCDMVVCNGAQDLFQVISCLEALILHLHEQFPDVDEIVLISDNASVFCGGDWVPWAIKLTRRYPFLRVSRYMNTEAQTGRDMLDAHFSFLNRLIDGYVRKDNAVQNPEQLFAALTNGGGVASTTTLLIDIDVNKSALYNNSKRSFSTKIKSGVRKIHDTVYDQACKSAAKGPVPMCKIFTNSEVPNSVMTSILSGIKRLEPPGLSAGHQETRIPRFICRSTHAGQIVASVVQKTLASEPHGCDVPQSKYETLTGVIVSKSFTSPKPAAPLRKTVVQALANDRAGDESGVASCTEVESFRCPQCSKRYASLEGRDRHTAGCTEYVVRDRDELIATAVQEFFTISKQTFAETRARSISLCRDTLDVSGRRSQKNWAEKESLNEFAVFPATMKEAIKRFYSEERASGRKVQPQQVMAFLFSTVVASSDWDARYLLSEQRLKTELSRLSRN